MPNELVFIVVLGLLAIGLTRWVYATPKNIPDPFAPKPRPDRGLLECIAVLPGPGPAQALRAILSDAGIRSTTSPLPDGRVEVLVFAKDVDRARLIAGPSAQN